MYSTYRYAISSSNTSLFDINLYSWLCKIGVEFCIKQYVCIHVCVDLYIANKAPIDRLLISRVKNYIPIAPMTYTHPLRRYLRLVFGVDNRNLKKWWDDNSFENILASTTQEFRQIYGIYNSPRRIKQNVYLYWGHMCRLSSVSFLFIYILVTYRLPNLG